MKPCIVTRGINMFESFDDWTKGAFALSNLGEDGRAMFKSISKLSSRYNEAENNHKQSSELPLFTKGLRFYPKLLNNADIRKRFRKFTAVRPINKGISRKNVESLLPFLVLILA